MNVNSKLFTIIFNISFVFAPVEILFVYMLTLVEIQYTANDYLFKSNQLLFYYLYMTKRWIFNLKSSEFNLE